MNVSQSNQPQNKNKCFMFQYKMIYKEAVVWDRYFKNEHHISLIFIFIIFLFFSGGCDHIKQNHHHKHYHHCC